MNGLLWTVVPFVILVIALAIMTPIHRKCGHVFFVATATKILALLCYAYLSVAMLTWGYVWLAQRIGYSWAAVAWGGFWFVPWLFGLMPFKVILMNTIDGAINYVEVRASKGCIRTDRGYIGRHLFWGCTKSYHLIVNDVCGQIRTQLKEKGVPLWKRVYLLHWRWYCPVVGGWSVAPRLIVVIKRHAESMFDRDWVKFECGHEGPATAGARRGRCRACKEK